MYILFQNIKNFGMNYESLISRFNNHVKTKFKYKYK